MFDFDGRAPFIMLRDLDLTVTLPPDMAYEEGSAQPPAVWDEAARTLRWRASNIGFGGWRAGFRLRPSLVGQRPGFTQAWALGAADIVLHAVGLGEDADLPRLNRLTADPRRVYPAADAAELAAVYRAIAAALPCPAGWAGR